MRKDYLIVILCKAALIFGLFLQGSNSQISPELKRSAYCQDVDGFDLYRHHPLATPERHLPWIWDALYDPVLQLVELTTLSTIPCRYRHDQWREMLSHFSEHRHDLSYGKESNILVQDPQITFEEETYLLRSTVYCDFLDDQIKIVATTLSLPIRGKMPFTSIGSLQIRCPAPNDRTWQRIRLRLNSNRKQHTTKIFSNTTASVPVCRLPTYSPKHKHFKLSACTATNRYDRAHLVEWIEYHRLVGVEHFFIYDTSTQNRTRLSSLLQDYVDEGVVTVIPWHYHNCVRNLAGGRWTVYRIHGQTKFFQAPRAIAQSAALASCYARFKHASKYMTHIDDDEFLSYSKSKLLSNLSTGSLDSLYDVSEAIFLTYPNATSIRFEPVLFWPCNISGHIERLPYNAIEYDKKSSYQLEKQSPLPRLGVWDLSEQYQDNYEAKLIMRTDAVGMFFVHFVSLVEDGPWEKSRQKTSITFDLTQLSVLHYKYPSSLSKKALEGELPMKKNAFEEDCKYWKRLESAGKVYHAQIPYDVASELKQRYLLRMS